MSGMKRIGILTSGGDCGGLNGVLKGAASMAEGAGVEVVIIPNGYAGLYNLTETEPGSLTILDRDRLDGFSGLAAGSEAGNSRVKISKIRDEGKYDRIKEGLVKHGIDGLIVSGGDDSGSVVVDLCQHGIPTNHAPKTMDMDLQTYSVGADSTINRTVTAIEELRTTSRTHNRILVFEVFGRHVGHTAFRAGIAAEADAILIPEIAPDFDLLFENVLENFRRKVMASDVRSASHIIITAEAMKGIPGSGDVNEAGYLVDRSKEPDAFGHFPLMGAGKQVETQLKRRLKADPRVKDFMREAGMFIQGQYEAPEVRVIRPTHLMRCGQSSAYDVNFGRAVGAGAVHLLLNGMTGATVADVTDGEVTYLPVKDAIVQRHVSLAQVSFFEQQGFFFGRKPEHSELRISELGACDRGRIY